MVGWFLSNLAYSLSGQVSVSVPTLIQGETQQCSYTITNDGTANLTAQAIRREVVAIANEQNISSKETTLNLDAGTTEVLERVINTAELEIGNHACVLQALIDGQWQNLGYAVFTVEELPIQIDTTLKLGERGRVLILLDETEPKDSEPHGPEATPTLTSQRAFLETSLDEAGWTYTIVTNAENFTREFRSGGYMLYAILSEQAKLAEQVQKELHEAVYRGEGLLVAGAHDQRNHFDAVLGIKHKGKSSQAQALNVGVETIPFAFAHQVPNAESTGALSIGTFQLDVDANCQVDDDDQDSDDDKSSDAKSKDDHSSDDDKSSDAKSKDDKSGDDKGSDAKSKDDKSDDDKSSDAKSKDDDHSSNNKQCYQGSKLAMTSHKYGEGHSVYVGFDLLAQATASGANSPFTELLIEALQEVHPEAMNTSLGHVVPIQLTLTNQNQATTGQVLIDLPEGIDVVVPAVVEWDELNSWLIWPFNLDEDQTLNQEFALRLPWIESSVSLNALLQTGVAPDFEDYDSITLTIEVQSKPCLPEALDLLRALQQDEDKNYAKVQKHLQKAAELIQAENDTKALKELVKAAKELAKSDGLDAHNLRVMVSNAIRNTAGVISITQ